MEMPIDSNIAKQYLSWSSDTQEYFQERAAIIEFMGHFPRLKAEQMAYEETIVRITSQGKS